MIQLSNQVFLQAISLHDHSTLVDLIERIYPPAYKKFWKNEDCGFYIDKFYNFDNLKFELSEIDSEYYFVYYDNTIAGILRVQYNQPYLDTSELTTTFLHRLYLGVESQGKGIAQQLLDWVETKAKLNGNTHICLKAMDTKEQALRFYQKQGYIKSDVTSLDYDLIHTHLRGMYVMSKLLR